MSHENLIQEFLIESREHLATIEPDLLALEAEANSPDLINRIFRAIHSIKGASGFFGFENLKRLSHVMENALMEMRDGRLIPRPDVVEVLLNGVDKLNRMVDDIDQSEQVPCQEVIASLEVILSGGQVALPAAAAPAETSQPTAAAQEDATPASSAGQLAFEPEAAAFEEALLHGHHFYAITPQEGVNQALADKLASVGKILDMKPQGLLLTSVLEADLICLGFELTSDEVQEVDKDHIQPKAPQPPAEVLAVPQQEGPALTPAKQQPPVQQARSAASEMAETVRVRVELLNNLMDLAGEMVLCRNQLLRAMGQESQQKPELNTILQNVNLITSDLQEHIMQTRMQPIGSVFGKFPRVVRDLARQLNKQIQLVMSGEDVELDKSIIESLSDPLTHLIRNCCDHAIELPADRRAVGKAEGGTITLKAYHEGGQINIAIKDDGRGIDTERIAQKLISQGIYGEPEVRRMSQSDLLNAIFLPGLSTAEKVSEISGRGVGMDVVRTNIEKMGGHISIESEVGRGTTILLRLPLTLAIIPSLIVGVQNQKFALPQINLVELVCVKAEEVPERIAKVGQANVLRLRGQLLPILRLADILDIERRYEIDGQQLPDRRKTVPDARFEQMEAVPQNRRKEAASDYQIVVLKVGTHQYGLIVDELFDMEEIVVKPLSRYLKTCKCFAGATIMGDGRVAMILDAGGILNYAKLSFTEGELAQAKEATDAQHDSVENRQAIILFTNALHEQFALPLADVLRLEKFNTTDIERVRDREFLVYRGKSLPIIRLEDFLPVSAGPQEATEANLIIPKAGHVGIVASRILDTLEVAVTLEHTLDHPAGIAGHAIIQGHLTVFINPEQLLAESRQRFEPLEAATHA
jgi:two-component system chemotaxis sensor kinase CheA